MATKQSDSKVTIEIMPIEKQSVTVSIVGTSPLILNRLSQKAKGQLLAPEKKSSARKNATLKHEPMDEFQASPHRLKSDDEPTLLAVMATAIKGAMRTSALDLPGATKAQVGRLTYIEGEFVPVFGVPQLFISVTRCADINHTPDIRTRTILPRWAAQFSITFVSPSIKAQSVLNLVAAGGITSGIGDWRMGKGSGNYGGFRVANADDEELLDIMASGGRAAQIAAMNEPEAYDTETTEMLAWFEGEAKRRGFR